MGQCVRVGLKRERMQKLAGACVRPERDERSGQWCCNFGTERGVSPIHDCASSRLTCLPSKLSCVAGGNRSHIGSPSWQRAHARMPSSSLMDIERMAHCFHLVCFRTHDRVACCCVAFVTATACFALSAVHMARALCASARQFICRNAYISIVYHVKSIAGIV